IPDPVRRGGQEMGALRRLGFSGQRRVRPADQTDGGRDDIRERTAVILESCDRALYLPARGELVEPRAQALVLRQAQDERRRAPQIFTSADSSSPVCPGSARL